MENNFNPSKKRKTNDGQAVPDGAQERSTTSSNFLSSLFGYYFTRRNDNASTVQNEHGNEQFMQQALSYMEGMKNTMLRMEEKLDTLSNVESRCKELEEKCSTLENMLKSTSQSTMAQLKYHEMLIRNQSWEYSAPLLSMEELSYDYTDEYASFLHDMSRRLENTTIAIRRGDFPNRDEGDKGIKVQGFVMDNLGLEDYEDFDLGLLDPHWEEFTDALKLFKPAFDLIVDGEETFIEFDSVQLSRRQTQLFIDALKGTRFTTFTFQYRQFFYGGMRAMVSMINNSRYLQKLRLEHMDLRRNVIAQLCSAIVNHPSLVNVVMLECYDTYPHDDNLMLLLPLFQNESKLEKLSLSCNSLRIRDVNISRQLANSIATNVTLTELELTVNELSDNDVILIADALTSNTTLRRLDISHNNVNEDTAMALRRVQCDERSLNAIADSNHSCRIETDYDGALEYYINGHECRKMNRARKMCRLLSSTNESLLQNFVDIDLKVLPDALAAILKYSSMLKKQNLHDTGALSVVYKIMRNWDKVPSLFNDVKIIN